MKKKKKREEMFEQEEQDKHQCTSIREHLHKDLLVVHTRDRPKCEVWSRGSCNSSVRMRIPNLPFKLPVVSFNAAVTDGKVNESGILA